MAPKLVLGTYGTGSAWLNVFIAFAAVAIWSSVPLTIRLLTTLKKRSGLYFYSILITTWGLSIRQLGYVLQFLVPSTPWPLGDLMAQLGWVAMVTGFSTVLYSRLNIILESRSVRRAVLYTIMFNGVVLHVLMITMSLGIAGSRYAAKHGSHHAATLLPRWQSPYSYMEKVQIVIFSLQEIAISFFYVRAAHQYLQSRFAQRGKTRQAMFLLLFVQIIIISVDIALIAIDFAGYLQLKLFIHSFVYSVKLELEFVVLNQLVELSRLGVPGIPSFSNALRADGSEEGREVKLPSFVTQAVPAWTPPDTPEPDSLKSKSSETIEVCERHGDREECHGCQGSTMGMIGVIPSV